MICQLCEREILQTEKHHLTPQNRKSETINVCAQCGDQLHLMFSNKKLKRDLNTLDKLKSDPIISKYINWVKTKPVNSNFCIKKKKRK